MSYNESFKKQSAEKQSFLLSKFLTAYEIIQRNLEIYEEKLDGKFVNYITY